MPRTEWKACSVALVVVLTFLFCCTTLSAQEGLSTLRGTVTDSSGALVPGVTITARDVSTNVVVRTVKTDAQGRFAQGFVIRIPWRPGGVMRIHPKVGPVVQLIIHDLPRRSGHQA